VCNIACTCEPVSHCAAGKPNVAVEAAVYLLLRSQLLRETSCSCDCSSAAVKAVVVQQIMSCFSSRFTNKEITKQEILTGCLLELLCSASSAPSTALLHTAGAHSPCRTSRATFCIEDRCKLVYVKSQDRTGTYYCTAWLSRRKKMLLFIVHMYLCTYIVLVSPNAQHHAVPASCKHPQATGCFYICLHIYAIRLLQAS